MAWPALASVDIGGWLWRCSGGGSQRANSVSTIDFRGTDVAAAIDDVEARYREQRQPARFQLYDASKPDGLWPMLADRGYIISEECTTLWKPVEAATQRPDFVAVDDAASDEWLEVYLAAQSESRQVVNRKIVPTVPGPRAFVSCRREGQVISTGLGVCGGPFAIIECMATRPEARRQGGAQLVLAGLEAWAADLGAKYLFLQAVAANTAAQRLYASFGMTPAGSYRFATRSLD